jgi:branched-chain amino acid transport system ATP-binding protein
MANNAYILTTKDLTRHFGGLQAVDGVDFKLHQGQLHSLIGPNGAGKTTFLNLISGTLKPTRGQVFYKGQDITGLPTYKRAPLGIGRSYQITNIFPTLTVLENVRLGAQALGSDNFKLFANYTKFTDYIDKAVASLELTGLSQMAEVPALSLPHGDKRRLEVAMLLAQDPEVLLLDEPTAGLAAEQVPEFMAMVHELSTKGDKTVLLVEHNMNVVMSLSDFVSVMHQGRLLAEGTPAEISANEVVQSAYLGEMYADFQDAASE